MHYCKKEEFIFHKVCVGTYIRSGIRIRIWLTGWLKWYEFSDVDLITAIKLAEELLSKQNMQMQWNYLKGLVCNAVYGGRIENEQDLRVLIAYLQQYFIDDVLSHKWRPFGLNIGLPNGTSYKVCLNTHAMFQN